MLTREERLALGKRARAVAPLESHAAFTPGDSRPDPIELLQRQSGSRVPELVPIRYGRMVASRFAFFRGAALIMAHDLASTPASELRVQLCGDAHLSNFGIFSSPERHLVFDINDFDETLPGPFEWDVKRLAASLAVVSRDNGFSTKQGGAVLLAGLGSYREAMRQFASWTSLAVWYAHLNVERDLVPLSQQLDSRGRRAAASVLAKARTHDSVEAFSRLARVVDGQPRIVSDPPLVVPIEDLLPPDSVAAMYGQLNSLLRDYQRTLLAGRRHLLEEYRLVHVAHKVVGVGSVGTRAWILLLQGLDVGDPLFLQAKEAQPSVLAAYAGRSKYRNQGQRVVVGQQRMQATSDVFLGWQRVSQVDGTSRDYYVRQLRDGKASAEIELMSPAEMTQYARLCGWTLACAHARTGDRVAIASYLGAKDRFDRAVTEFAEAYADRNALDYERLRAAVDRGEVKVLRE